MRYNGNYKKKRKCEFEQIYKNFLSSDYAKLLKFFTLKFERMKEELLVIVNNDVTVNCIIRFVHTARQVLGI